VNSACRLTFSDYARLLRGNRNYRLLWLAQIVSELGDWLYSVVIYGLLLDRTGNASAVATAVVLQVLPQVLISPVAGVVNDRARRRTVMIAADVARFFIVLAMLWASHQPAVWPIYALLLVETLLWGFFEPGRSALLPNLTRGERETLAANTLASTTWSFNLAAGTALGGLLAVWLGRDIAFLINAFSFLVSAALLLGIRIEEPHAAAGTPLKPADLVDFTPMMEGFRYIAGDRRLLATLLAKTGLGFMGANYIILTIMGERMFPVAESPLLGMSLLMFARGLGALLGPWIGGYWAGASPPRLRRGILYGFFAAAAGYIALSGAPALGAAIACVTLAHGGGSVIWVFSTTMLQTQAEDRFRGRVFSADFAFLIVTMSLSAWLAGLAVDWGIPVRRVSLALGVLILVPAALWWSRAIPLWRDDEDS